VSDVKAGSVRVDLLAKLGKWLKDFDKADKSLSKLENQTERSSRTFKHTSNTMLKLGQATRSAQARLQKMNRTMRDGERVAEKFDKRYGLVLDRMQSVGRSVGIAGGIITALAVGAIAKASKESDILKASLLGLTAVAPR